MGRFSEYVWRFLERIPLQLRWYAALLVEETGNLVALFVMSVLISWGLLYTIMGAWALYTSTYAGHYFELLFSERAVFVDWLLDQQLFEIALDISIISFTASLALSILAQISYIRHLFYSRRGYIAKAAAILALTWFVVFEYQEVIDIRNWEGLGYLIFAPSMLLLVPGGMRAAGALIPDPGGIYSGLGTCWYFLKRKLNLEG